MGLKEAFISTRPWSFPMTIIIVSVGSVYAYLERSSFNMMIYLMTLLGVLSLHASVNLLNDYFDYTRNIDTPESPTAKYRPHPILVGFYSPNFILLMSIIYAIIGLSSGIYLTYITNLITLVLGSLGLLLVYMYNGPPFGLKYKALGELEVFIAWGMLMALGSYYVQTQFLSVNVILVSAPLGLLVSAVLLANNLRDIDFDKNAGIKTLPVLLGLKRGLKLYEILLYMPFIIQVTLISLRIIPLITLLTLVTLIDAYKLVKIFKQKVPEASDPMTANFLIKYGIIYLITLIAGLFIKL